MADAKSKAQGIINDNGVVVFSKSYCPYCKATKSLLSEKGANFFLMELDQVCKCLCNPLGETRREILMFPL